MIGGDQHLSTVVHHGIDDWQDAGYSYGVPSIANHYLRFWMPQEEGLNRQPGMQDYIGQVYYSHTITHHITGDFYDGFKNKVTLWAVANPQRVNRDPALLHDLAPGYGIVKFNKNDRTITMESWPRYVDPRAPGAQPYLGWPLTINQEDNYGKQAVEYLPTLQIGPGTDPVVQVINETNGEVEYTLRINGNTFRPKVFQTGKYTIVISNSRVTETLKGIQSLPPNQTANLVVNLDGIPVQKPSNQKIKIGKIKINWNKVSKQVQLAIPNSGDYLIDIVDVKGAIAISRKVKGQGKYNMSIPFIKSGTYIIKTRSNGKVVKKKITVAK